MDGYIIQYGRQRLVIIGSGIIKCKHIFKLLHHKRNHNIFSCMDGSLKQNLFWRSRISDYDIINIPAVERLADDINCHAVPIAGGEGADIILHLFIGILVDRFYNRDRERRWL